MTITEQEFLRAEVEDMNLTMKNEPFVNLAKSVANYCKKFDAASVIDFGCGTGVYAEVLRMDGYNIMAQDVFKSHRDYCKAAYPELSVIMKPKAAELMLFIEVAEHMTNEEIITAIELIQPKVILFSSTPHTTENDQQWGHINIKQEDEWIEFWSTLGYKVLERPQTPTSWTLTLEEI
jgi:2-polyprenyl-3-methyl-5-hydroxy-6-metoxy-1,4-benzoquinol methylase